MAVYLVSTIEVIDHEKLLEFQKTAPRPSGDFGGEQVLRGNVVDILEGDVEEEEIVVVMRFPSEASARAMINSASFKAARERRLGLARVTIRLVSE